MASKMQAGLPLLDVGVEKISSQTPQVREVSSEGDKGAALLLPTGLTFEMWMIVITTTTDSISIF